MPRQPHDSAGSDMETEYRQGLFMLIFFLSLSCIFFCKFFISYIEDGDSIELATDTDKREYNTESYGVFEDTFDKLEEKKEMLSKMVELELMQI